MKEQEQNPYAVMTLADHVPRPSKWQYHFENNVIPIFGNGGMHATFMTSRFYEISNPPLQKMEGAVMGEG